MEVPLRFYIRPEENNSNILQIDCISLPEINFKWETKGVDRPPELFEKIINITLETVDKYIQNGKTVPWIAPTDLNFKKIGPYPGDGGNQTIWIDLPLTFGNWPHGFATVQCISCNEILTCEYVDQEPPSTIHCGLRFVTKGNYGSTVFDMDTGELHLYLCDKCARKKSDSIKHIVWKKREYRQAEKIQSLTDLQIEEEKENSF